MGKIIDSLLHRNKTDDEANAILGATAVQVGAALAQNLPATEAEARKEEGINRDMIEDEKLIQLIESLISIPYTVSEYVPTKLDGKGKPLEYELRTFERTKYNSWAAALRVYVSKVMATRYIDPIDVYSAKLRLRRNFLAIERKMTKKDRVTFGELIDAIREYCEGSLDDSKQGRKSFLLKVQQKRMEVGLNRAGAGLK